MSCLPSILCLLSPTMHGKVSDLYLFLQEVVFGMPSEVKKKLASYTSFCVAIEASEKLDFCTVKTDLLKQQNLS